MHTTQRLLTSTSRQQRNFQGVTFPSSRTSFFSSLLIFATLAYSPLMFPVLLQARIQDAVVEDRDSEAHFTFSFPVTLTFDLQTSHLLTSYSCPALCSPK